MIYYISLYPTPGYMRHFVIEETDPHKAVHRLNYFARLQYKLLLEADPKDTHHKALRCKHIVVATRRYRRYTSRKKSTYKDRRVVCTVKEIPLKVPWEGHLNIAGNDNAYAWNILESVQL